MKAKLQVLDQNISTYVKNDIEYICITDIAKYKGTDRAAHIIGNWIRNRNTIEFLGIWEQLNNANFKVLEFEVFKKEAGLNSFTLTPKQWQQENPDFKGNMRDHANIHQLLCLANIESLNAHFISEGMVQTDRLVKLNQVAIRQMQVLVKHDVRHQIESRG